MKLEELNLVTRASAEFGKVQTADERTALFIDLTLSYSHQGTTHTTPALTLTPDAARSLAMLLLSLVEKVGDGDTNLPRSGPSAAH